MDTSRYADLFLTESREHLSAINHAMLELERTSGDGEAVGALFRAVHTLKGMSATMGYAAVAELTHELETLLDVVRRGERAVTATLMDLLFQAADMLEEIVALSVSGRAAECDIAALAERLRAAGGGGSAGGAAAGARAPGAPADAAPLWRIALPPGDGLAVRVRIAGDAPLPGVRAYLVLQRARALGEVLVVVPPVDELQAERFDREFALRLATDAPAARVAEALRAAGEVDAVEVDERPLDAPAGAARAAPQRHVRIDLRRLDALMNLIGELVITRGRLVQLAAGLADPGLDETVAQASRLISDLQDEIMTSRMVPVAQIFDRFPRLVRDAARALGKQVDFRAEGQEIELDRSMLDEIGEPIVHLLRNAIDHGIEAPATRAAAGKAPAGRLVLSAARDRSAVLIRVSDDGRGIDRERVLARAREGGLVEASRAELSDEELVRLISRPGFSTAERVSDISGRGVGIDAVQTRVRALGGSLDIRSVPGEGTSVTVRLPLTLAIVRAILARVGDETYALAMTHVSETVELEAAERRTVRGRDVLVVRDEVLPLLRLRELVRLPAASDEAGAQVVILEVGERRAALVVDEMTGQQEIVVKQFDAVRADAGRDGASLFTGATILGDGAPALILDVSTLV